MPRPNITTRPTEVPDTGRRSDLRRVATFLILGAIVLIQGCARPYGATLRQYVEAPPCCSSLTELPVEPIALGEKKSIELGKGSPAYEFETGKSYFRAYALPQKYPYRVTVSSFFVGEDLKSAYIFFPQIVTLDARRQIVRQTTPESFSLQRTRLGEALADHAGLRHKLVGGLTFTEKNSNERFLVILTTGELLAGKTLLSTVGDVPLLTPGYTAVIPGEGKKEPIPHSPAGKLSVSITSLSEQAAVAADISAVSPELHPEMVTVRKADGKVAGRLELGKTTVETAQHLFDEAGVGLGPERQNNARFTIGPLSLTPERLFVPPASHYQLYFASNGLRLVVVDSAPVDLPHSGKEFLHHFPAARETGRTQFSYEVQLPLSECVNLAALFNSISDSLESVVYGYSCQAK